MRTILFLCVIFIFIGIFYVVKTTEQQKPSVLVSQPSVSKPAMPSSAHDALLITVATGLDTPWAIAILPDKSMLVTERPGRVRLIDAQGNLVSQPVALLPQAKEIGEGGLLGITLHPQFSSNQYVYLYYTYSASGNDTRNRVVRMTYKDASLQDEKIIVDAIPGNVNHNGGRIKFGPDNNLYITTGDAGDPSLAQNTTSLAGKILRVTDTGKPAPGNPFGNAVYSYGHRNPQGIAWDASGVLWETEHGRSSPTGFDEVNRIEMGKNYGWPIIQGDEARNGMVTPVRNSGPSITWAPAGMAFVDGALYFGGLRGQALYKTIISGSALSLTEHLKGQLGRIREVIAGNDGYLYITTSNQDGRGIPQAGDDKVLRVAISLLLDE